MKGIIAVIFSTLLFAPAAMALDIEPLDTDPARSTFIEGYEAAAAKDTKKHGKSSSRLYKRQRR